MVFLAVVMAINIGLVLLDTELITARSPSKQRVGDNGRLHPGRFDIFSNNPLPEIFLLGDRATWHDGYCLRCYGVHDEQMFVFVKPILCILCIVR